MYTNMNTFQSKSPRLRMRDNSTFGLELEKVHRHLLCRTSDGLVGFLLEEIQGQAGLEMKACGTVTGQVPARAERRQAAAFSHRSNSPREQESLYGLFSSSAGLRGLPALSSPTGLSCLPSSSLS